MILAIQTLVDFTEHVAMASVFIQNVSLMTIAQEIERVSIENVLTRVWMLVALMLFVQA